MESARFLPSVLLVEDDALLSNTLKDFFKNEYNLTTTKNCAETKNALKTKKFDLYIIDLTLEETIENGGLEICRLIRKDDKTTPIIVSTAKTAINFKVISYNLGVDGYLCKPYSLIELNAMVKAFLKKAGTPKSRCNIQINEKSRLVIRNNRKIELRNIEFQILSVLVRQRGEVLSRDQIINCVYRSSKYINYNTIDVHIKNLREKFDTPFNTNLIKTVYGIGYKLDL